MVSKKCDNKILEELKKTKSETAGKKIMKTVTQDVIGSKYQLGFSVKQTKPINKLFPV